MPPELVGDEARRARLLVRAAQTQTGVTLAFAMALAVGGAVGLAAAVLATVLFTAVALIGLRRTGHVARSTRTLLAGLAAMLVPPAMWLGGLSSPTVPMLVLLPLVAVASVSRREGLVWTLVAIACVGLVSTLELQELLPPAAMSPKALYGFRALAAVALFTSGYLLARAFHAASSQAYESLRDALGQLRDMAAPIQDLAQQLRAPMRRLTGRDGLIASMAARETEGHRTLARSRERLTEVLEHFETVGLLLAAVQEQATSVSTVAHAVDDLARELDTVAVNSQLRAIRAGESAAGFGIVASELARLADQVKSEVARSGEPLDRVRTAAERCFEAGSTGAGLAMEGVGALETLSTAAQEALAQANTLRASVSALVSEIDRELEAVSDLVRAAEGSAASAGRAPVEARGWLRPIGATREETRRVRLLLGYALSLGLAVASFTPVFVWSGDTDLALIALSSLAPSLATVLLVRRRGSLVLATNVFAGASMVVLTAAALFMGGLVSASVPALVLLGLLATYTAGPRVGAVWWLAAVAIVVAFAVSSLALSPPASALDPLTTTVVFSGAWAALVALAYSMARAFDLTRSRARERLAARAEDLRELLDDLGALLDVLDARAGELGDDDGPVVAMLRSAEQGRGALLQVDETVRRALDYFRTLAEETGHLSDEADSLASALEEMDRVTSRLHAVAVSAHLEAVRAASGEGFGAVADEMTRLADVVRTDADRTRRPLAQLRSTCGAAAESGQQGAVLVDAGQSELEALMEAFVGGLSVADELRDVADGLAQEVAHHGTTVRRLVASAAAARSTPP